jgi:hypothetical protein
MPIRREERTASQAANEAKAKAAKRPRNENSRRFKQSSPATGQRRVLGAGEEILEGEAEKQAQRHKQRDARHRRRSDHGRVIIGV